MFMIFQLSQPRYEAVITDLTNIIPEWSTNVGLHAALWLDVNGWFILSELFQQCFVFPWLGVIVFRLVTLFAGDTWLALVDTAGHLPQLRVTSSRPEVPCMLAHISPTSVYIYHYQVCKLCSIEPRSIDLHFAVCVDTSWRDTSWRPTSSYVIRVLIPWHRCALKASFMLRCRGGTSQNFAYFKNNSWTKVVPR